MIQGCNLFLKRKSNYFFGINSINAESDDDNVSDGEQIISSSDGYETDPYTHFS